MPTMLDRDIDESQALVVDANPTSRSILAAQLREFGVTTVTQCSRMSDARRLLEHRSFDIVLCEQHFTNEPGSGQDLLDELRREQLLPFSTVFIMITGEASYAKVAEAAESALDGYLLKPHTATALGERLREARHRKKVLKDIFQAIEAGAFDNAARLCLQRFHDRGTYWLHAARIGAELLLRLNQHGAAQKLFEAVTATNAVPWARLGVARAQLESGQAAPATRTLEALLVAQPTYADAYDVMGRAQVEQGQFASAQETYRKAADLTPSSITRQQKLGMLAFYMGDRAAAAQALERAVRLGVNSKMFDFQSTVLLAFVHFADRDSKALQRCVESLARACEKAPDSARLERFHRVARTLGQMLGRQVGQVVEEVKALAAEIAAPNFDAEAACNLLALVAQLTGAELQLEQADAWIDRLAQRFCVSRAVTELLVRSAQAHEPHALRVRQGQQRITELSERAMSHTLAGNAAAAVTDLLGHAEETANIKLLDTARLTLQRHHERIADVAALSERIEALRQRYGQVGTPPLGQTSGGHVGGVPLRHTGSGQAGAVPPGQTTSSPLGQVTAGQISGADPDSRPAATGAVAVAGVAAPPHRH